MHLGEVGEKRREKEGGASSVSRGIDVRVGEERIERGENPIEGGGDRRRKEGHFTGPGAIKELRRRGCMRREFLGGHDATSTRQASSRDEIGEMNIPTDSPGVESYTISGRIQESPHLRPRWFKPTSVFVGGAP